MSLFKIAWRSIQERAFASFMTGLSMALGVALVVAVLVLQNVISTSFNRAAEGYDLIIGAKGGRLELVLNTVFHLGQPIENIPWNFYKEFTKEGITGEGRPGKYSSAVDVAVPYCLGDNYKGHRIVGTTPALFKELGYSIDPDGKPILYRFSSGECFEQSDFFGAVIGYVAASDTGLKVGDHFQATHGVTTDQEVGKTHPDDFFVRGILAPNGTPNDRAVFVNMEGFFLLEGHAKEVEGKPAAAHADGHREPLPEDQREVTAILIRTSQPTDALMLPRSINKGNVAQAVSPIREIRNLYDGLIGGIQIILLVLSFLIVIVASVGIMVSIYNSMSDRRREIAIMRALGAGRGTVRTLILLESILLSVLGGGAGFLLGHGLIGVASKPIAHLTGVPVGLFQFVLWELVLIPLLIVLASLAGLIPALAAYRTDVAKTLSQSP